jgi:hypothetical protein
MKNNAIKFNGEGSQIAQEAVAIYDFVRDQVDSSRQELSALEEAVEDQMSGKPKSKKRKKAGSKSKPATTASIGGVSINLGDLSSSMHFTGADSDSDESFEGLLDL